MRLELDDELKEIIEEQEELEIPVDWVSRAQALDRYLNRQFGNWYGFGQSA
jgi:hypothetical protein